MPLCQWLEMDVQPKSPTCAASAHLIEPLSVCQGLHQQEAGIRNQSWDSNPGTPMWDEVVLHIALFAKMHAHP